MPFAGGGNSDYPTKKIKIRWTAEFEQEVVVPASSAGDIELLVEYLGVSGDLKTDVHVYEPNDTFRILKIDDKEIHYHEWEANDFGAATRAVYCECGASAYEEMASGRIYNIEENS